MRHWFITILLGSILASVVIPQGYMPSQQTDVLGFVVCQSEWGASDSSDDRAAHAPCAFAVTPTAHTHYVSGCPIHAQPSGATLLETNQITRPSRGFDIPQARAPPHIS